MIVETKKAPLTGKSKACFIKQFHSVFLLLRRFTWDGSSGNPGDGGVFQRTQHCFVYITCEVVHVVSFNDACRFGQSSDSVGRWLRFSSLPFQDEGWTSAWWVQWLQGDRGWYSGQPQKHLSLLLRLGLGFWATAVLWLRQTTDFIFSVDCKERKLSPESYHRVHVLAIR